MTESLHAPSQARAQTAADKAPVAKNFTFVVNPRRGKVWGASKQSTAPVELSLEVLKPYFRKPLSVACFELGLSASAIKKACRAFGIPKWPCRSLTARHSINKEVMEEVSEGRSNSEPTSPTMPSVPVNSPTAPELAQQAPLDTTNVPQASAGRRGSFTQYDAVQIPQAYTGRRGSFTQLDNTQMQQQSAGRRGSLRSSDPFIPDFNAFGTVLHAVHDASMWCNTGQDGKAAAAAVLTTEICTSTPKNGDQTQFQPPWHHLATL